MLDVRSKNPTHGTSPAYNTSSTKGLSDSNSLSVDMTVVKAFFREVRTALVNFFSARSGTQGGENSNTLPNPASNNSNWNVPGNLIIRTVTIKPPEKPTDPAPANQASGINKGDISSSSRDKLKDIRKEIVEGYRNAINLAIEDPNPFELPAPAGANGKWELRTGPLGPKEITNVLKALNKCDFDWGKLTKDYANANESAKQLVADVRAYQKEIVDALITNMGGSPSDLLAVGSTALTSDLDYTSILKSGQDKQVEALGSAFREIFGKESGVVFDTNFYTAHIALEKGFSVNGNEQTKQKWINQNDVQSKVKQAEHYQAFDDGVTGFKQSRFFKNVASPTVEKVRATKGGPAADQELATFENAFDKAKSVAVSVTNKSEEIINTSRERVATLASKAGSLSPSEKLELNQLKSKLNDPKAIEIEAKNKLYADTLTRVEAGKKEYDALSVSIDTKIASSSTNPTKQAEVKNWIEGGCKFDSIPSDVPKDTTDQLADLNKRKQAIGTETMALQSEALHYASEPYYAQATVVGVVAGIQMVGELGAKIFQNSRSNNPDFAVFETMDLVGLDAKKMIGDMLQLGEISKKDQAILAQVDSRKEIMAKIELAKTAAQTQLAKDYPVLDMPETAKFSGQENFGDFVKDYGHYVLHPMESHAKPDMAPGKIQTEESKGDQFMLKGSKYLYRTALCIDMYMEKSAQSGTPTPIQKAFKELKLMAKEMLDIRQGVVKGKPSDIRSIAHAFLTSPTLEAFPELKTKIDEYPGNPGKALFEVVECMMTKI